MSYLIATETAKWSSLCIQLFGNVVPVNWGNHVFDDGLQWAFLFNFPRIVVCQRAEDMYPAELQVFQRSVGHQIAFIRNQLPVDFLMQVGVLEQWFTIQQLLQFRSLQSYAAILFNESTIQPRQLMTETAIVDWLNAW